MTKEGLTLVEKLYWKNLKAGNRLQEETVGIIIEVEVENLLRVEDKYPSVL